MVFLGVGGDHRDNFAAETLDVTVVRLIANVVTPAKAHYHKRWRPHCDLAGEFAPSTAPFNRKKEAYQEDHWW